MMDTQAQSRQARRRGLGQRAALAALLAVAVSPAADANTTRVIVDGFYYDIGSEFTNSPPTSTTPSNRYAPWFGSGDTAGAFAIAAFDAGVGTESTVRFAYGKSGTTNNAEAARPNVDGSGGIEAYYAGINGSAVFAYVDGAPVVVPEIDGAALAQGALAIAGVGLWFAGRGRAGHARGDTRMGASLSAAPVH
ncbi:hypothetical protein V6X63_10160 [Spiribacter sp. 221]|uniref:hypothetical protein n=1 Tax=Spiribacter onubensis TaxID=3122420 RepID=UPI00349F9E7A